MSKIGDALFATVIAAAIVAAVVGLARLLWMALDRWGPTAVLAIPAVLFFVMLTSAIFNYLRHLRARRKGETP